MKPRSRSALAGVGAVMLAVVSVSTAGAQTTTCKNGRPDWASKALEGRCESQGADAPQAKPQRIVRPKVAKHQPAATARTTTKNVAAPAIEAAAPVAGITPQATLPSAPGPAKSQCRRYLASTGQTVEVPCS